MTSQNPATPAISVRRSDSRGHARHGWLESRHTFSFGDYFDPDHMGFSSLRVINQDWVAPGRGFPTHPHKDTEIFSYVLEGGLQHRDSMGNERVLEPGQIQLMSAGTGITHSEFNASKDRPLRFLQIWIQPRQKGLEPAYTEWHPPSNATGIGKVLVISPDGRENSATIRQDADVYRILIDPGSSVVHALAPQRGLWLQVIEGPASLNAVELSSGDAAFSEESGDFVIGALDKPVEALLFDLG